MVLTYWCARCLTDASAYNIRARTRRECRRLVEEAGDANRYSEPFKVVFQYSDGFDLLARCLGESGGPYEYPEPTDTRPCVGCKTGRVPYNQGSDYCDACIEANR